jgi:hypothetical protein
MRWGFFFMGEASERTEEWISFSPDLGRSAAGRRTFNESLSALIRESHAMVGGVPVIDRVLNDRARWPRSCRDAIAVALSVADDLLLQGWDFRHTPDGWHVRRPSSGGAAATRDLRRGQLAMRRSEQLREAAARDFVTSMERPRLTSTGRASIYDLMCDGGELAARVSRESTSIPIVPYLQLVGPDDVCQQSGLRLQDIWRYFRHTWSNAYESVPGRSVQLLVRDAAAPCHAVIGVLSLGSAAIKIRCRDHEIGWDSELVLADILGGNAERWATWAGKFVVDKFSEVYRIDLLRDELLPTSGLGGCTAECVAVLREESQRCRALHQGHADVAEFVKGKDAEKITDEEWERLATTMLFRSKRCGRLAELIEIALALGLCERNNEPVSRLSQAHEVVAIRAAVGKLVRYARSETVGTEIADITVCGAVPPYSELLGGKMVAMLATSGDLVRCYRERYSGSPSIIASSMAGRRIERTANLAFLGTTSLYGVRPSQYDRAAIPCELIGGRAGERVRYRYLDRTEGFGTSQISDRTQLQLAHFLAQRVGKRSRVNNVFGEGANPRMRAIREALGVLGLPSEQILRHGQAKCVYGVHLLRNTRDYLLRLESKPDYLFDDAESPHSPRIAEYWFERWVRPRLCGHELLDRVRAHSTIRPVKHGARVVLPEVQSKQVPLFFDLT